MQVHESAWNECHQSGYPDLVGIEDIMFIRSTGYTIVTGGVRADSQEPVFLIHIRASIKLSFPHDLAKFIELNLSCVIIRVGRFIEFHRIEFFPKYICREVHVHDAGRGPISSRTLYFTRTRPYAPP
jgi:hypothetical protein